MKILVAGGAGFIGSHLCDSLIALGHQVTAVDNLSLGTLENIGHLRQTETFSFVQADILDESALNRLFAERQFEMIFHLAANSDIAISRESPDVDYNQTLRTTYHLLNHMRVHNVKKILFASTSAVYGEAGSKLLSENMGPLLPVSHYGAAKLASEAFIASFAENYTNQAWIIRFPNVVGERSTHGILHDFVKKLRNNPDELEVLGNGKQNKPYMYVKDLIDAMLFIWQNTREKINLYNVGVQSKTTVRDIAALVIREMGLTARIRYTGGDRGWIGDVPEFNYDLSKIHALGWKARESSDEAVGKAIRKILKKE